MREQRWVDELMPDSPLWVRDMIEDEISRLRLVCASLIAERDTALELENRALMNMYDVMRERNDEA